MIQIIFLTLAITSGFMLNSYEGTALRNSWPKSKTFNFSDTWLIDTSARVLGMFLMVGVPIVSLFIIKWWIVFIMFFIGFTLAYLLTYIFKSATQLISFILGISMFLKYAI